MIRRLAIATGGLRGGRLIGATEAVTAETCDAAVVAETGGETIVAQARTQTVVAEVDRDTQMSRGGGRTVVD